jgi:4-carboxymuconolactone decarboxylase
MTEEVRTLIRISAALARSRPDQLERELRAARGVDARAVEEVLLQSYLFLGYPAALRGLAAWRTISGVAAPADTPDEDPATWWERGARTCERVYGGQYARLRSNIAALHPDVERWMLLEGYGKVLSRPGLDLAVRELCIIALLASQDAAPQLYSHLRGALNAGASLDDVEETVRLLRDLLGREQSNRLAEQWRAVLARRTDAADRN